MSLNKRQSASFALPSRAASCLAGLQRRVATWLHSTHKRWPWLRRGASALLLIGGLLFVMQALRGQLADLPAAAADIPPLVFPALVLLATLTVLVTASLHAEIVEGTVAAHLDPARVRYAYAASQVARYVPGKVFGVILEAQMLAPVLGVGQVVAVTLLQTLLAYAWAGTAAVCILGALALDSGWPTLLAPVVLGLLWLAQRNRWPERARSLLPDGTRGATAREHSTESSRRSALRGTLLLALQWVPFFTMWILLAAADHGFAGASWLGASYLLASITGSLLVLVPSGLVVREAAFVWLGGLHGLPASSLLAWAVIVRLALTFADILAVPVLWVVLRLQRRPCRGRLQ